MNQVQSGPVDRLDKIRVRRAFGRAAARYDAAAVLQKTVQADSLERLDVVRLAPRRILDLGCGTGGASRLLRARYRGAQVLSADLALPMLHRQRAGLAWWRRSLRVCADAEALPFAARSFDLIYSNLMLQWCHPPEAVLTEVARVLRAGGLFSFTTFGPDTLRELRGAWGQVDEATHVSTFVDMHDLGEALVRCGYQQPVLDVERYTLTYATLDALARDLKAIGAHNAAVGRHRRLTGKGRWRALVAAYEQYREAGVLPASYEVIHGHAWRGEQPAADGALPLHFHPPRQRPQA